MKFVGWCVGAFQIATGLMLAWSIAPAWRWVWLPLAFLWFFVGCTLAVLGLSKLISGKMRMGAARPHRAGEAHAPTDEKEE